MFKYNEDFYKYIEQTRKDEEIVIPFILQWISPKSIVDFGCAEGAWLAEALKQNSSIDILGLDGSYVDRNRLKIPKENFKAVDLRQSISTEKKYDLAISLEVAEHLEQEFADIFIDNITRVSDQVLFSAAIPGQGGEHHVNEQWQSYWIEKFEKRGYYCDYSIRNYFWNEPQISSWRRQNLLFFSKKKGNLAPERPVMDVVHPEEAAVKRRFFEDTLDYYIFYPETAFQLKQVIKRLIKQDKKIVIYPYGKNGKLCEKILRDKYEVKDYILADNMVEETEKTILSAKQLKDIADKIVIIDTCSNSAVHKETLDELLKYVSEENIYSAFELERV